MIGIFDSGVGGLTVLRAIKDVLPSSDIVYFGDIKNAPYGLKTREELFSLTVRGIKLLQEQGARAIVSACNSVSASLAVSLLDAFSLTSESLVEMVGPTVSAFKGSSAKLAVCATVATIESRIYQNAFQMIGKDVECIAIPELAGAIESGASQDEIEHIVRKAFPEGAHFDALILACTHYPIVINTFRTILGEKLYLYDPAAAVAERVEKQFWPREVGDGSMRFLISKDSSQFRTLVAEFFQKDKYTIEVIE